MKTHIALPIEANLHHSDVVLNPAVRTISITATDNFKPNAPEHGNRCDRWGHPCAACITSRRGSEQDSAIFGRARIER